VLDLMLPDGSGLDVCRDIRAESDVPIIMLTARSTEIDRVIGLEVGADDYLVKPFSLLELVSRIRAQVRRRRLDRSQRQPVVVVGDLELDLVRQEARVDGKPISLTPAEMRLATTLAAEPDRVYTRDELMASLWGANLAGASRACDTHVLNLRRKLDGSSASIETVRGVGYRLRVV
jgi:DNA-binding response OmpR family regulator